MRYFEILLYEFILYSLNEAPRISAGFYRNPDYVYDIEFRNDYFKAYQTMFLEQMFK